MNLVRRTIERKSKRGTRYKYLILPNKLSILFNDGEEPTKIVVVLTHRKRRYECNVRNLEAAASGNSHKRVVEWPPANTDTIHFNVTFFKLPNSDQFDDKEWKVAVESRDEKGGLRLLASTTLNLQNFAGRSLEMTLGLRAAAESLVHDCQLTLTFISTALRGFACFAVADDNSTMYSGAAVIRMPTGSYVDEHIEAEKSDVVATAGMNGGVRDSVWFSTVSGRLADSKQKDEDDVADAFIRRLPSLTVDNDGSDDDGASRCQLSGGGSAKPPSRPPSAVDSRQPAAERRPTPSIPAPVSQVEAPSVSKVIEELELMTQRKEEELRRFQQEEEEERVACKSETDRQQLLREEARRLMRDALQSSTGAAAAGQQQRSFMVHNVFHVKSASPEVEGGGLLALRSSKTDLRTLDFVTPRFNFRQFSLRQPSPFLQRKLCESPLLPSFGLSSSVSTTAITTDDDSSAAAGADASDATRLNIGGNEEEEESCVEPEHESVRKITSRLEQEMQNPASKIQEDLDEIADRIAEVERLDAYVVGQKMKNTELGSAEEQKFIEQHLRYLTEKEALVRQQDYLNVLIDLKETADKIEQLQRLINQSTADELHHTETLMIELKTLIDKKDELSHILINKETEEEEEKERGKLLVQQSQSFVRGTVEPLSASKRILTWFYSSPRSPRNTAAN